MYIAKINIILKDFLVFFFNQVHGVTISTYVKDLVFSSIQRETSNVKNEYWIEFCYYVI